MLGNATKADRQILWLMMVYCICAWGIVLALSHFVLGWP